MRYVCSRLILHCFIDLKIAYYVITCTCLPSLNEASPPVTVRVPVSSW